MSSGPAHRVQSAVVEYGYPSGHLGHLNEEEENALKNFKALCLEKGVYKPGGEGEAPSHDDPTLLRYLRARRFVPADAYSQFKDTEDWRKANQLEALYETIDLEHFEETRRLYPQWTGRRDKRGIPVYVYEVKHLNSKTMSAYEKSATNTRTQAETDGTVSPKLIRLFALYEHLVRFVLPLCSALTDRDNPRTPITQSNNIVDISGVGLKQFWNLRTHMQDASTLATAHYPETLDRIFIIGAPSFFPTVWGWIKKWFDPITTSKIFIIAAADVKTTLESFIEPANIPKKYGGELDFEFGDFPNLDPAIKDVAEWETGTHDFPHGPVRWVNLDPGVRWEDGKGGEKMKAVAVGTVEEKQRKEDICTVTRKLEPLVSQPDKPVNRALRPDLLQVPTATSSVTNLPATDGAPLENLSSSAVVPPPVTTSSGPNDTSGVKLELNGQDDISHDNLETTTSRPEIERFVTAREDLNTIPTHEHVPEVPKIDETTTTTPSQSTTADTTSTVPPSTTTTTEAEKENIPSLTRDPGTIVAEETKAVNGRTAEPIANGTTNGSTNGKRPETPTNGNHANEKAPDSPGIGRSSTDKLQRVVPKIKNLLHHNHK